MSALPDESSQDENERLEIGANQAIEACGGDPRAAIRALILANEFLQRELETKERLRARVKRSRPDFPRGIARDLKHTWGQFLCGTALPCGR